MIPTNLSGLPGLQVIVIAAGYSRRLGRSKALVRIHGVSLLRATLSKLRGVSSRTPIVVVPPRSSAIRYELRGMAVRLVANPRRAVGQSTSVRLGLARARYAPAALLMPCDLVALDRRELLALVARWQAARRKIVARRLSPPRGGTPLILPRGCFAAASRVGGDAGLRDYLSTIPVGQKRLVDLPSADADVDTPRDLAEARRRWAAAAPSAARAINCRAPR